MKRSLVLTTALSLIAVPLFASLGVAQTSSTVRGTTVKVSAATTPARDRSRPHVFTTTGKITPPSKFCAPGATPKPGAGNCIPIKCPVGVTDASYCTRPATTVVCSGKVTVRFQKGGATISSRIVNVKADCTYRSKVTFNSRLRTRVGRFSVRSRFAGNAVLLPRTSATRTVRAG